MELVASWVMVRKHNLKATREAYDKPLSYLFNKPILSMIKVLYQSDSTCL